MATEEEPREAADGKEVQVEAVDSEPLHMHTHLDSKLSSMEIKKVAETIDSTEEKLKIPEVQVLVDAPSEIKLQLEHNLNGTSSSLNGHIDEEIKVSNEQLHKDSKKDPKQAEAALHGESTDQNNKINKEANDCLSHGENTIEDSSLLRHDNEDEPKGDDQQDKDPMQDTLKTNSNMDQSKLVDQLDMDPEKATEGTQPGMENIPNAEVVTEAHAEVQISLGPNLTDSDAIPDTVGRSTETDEAAVEDGAIHLEHRESYPDDISSDKHTEEVVKCGAMDADAAQEDIPKCEETGVLEETPESEHADVPTIVAQEVLHQEPSEYTNGPTYEKMEQTSHQRSMVATDDKTSEHDSTTCEPPVDIQVKNKKSLEEIKYADKVDTEATMQKSCIAFEEAISEYNIATTEQDSVETNNTESAETHNVNTAPSSEEDKVEDGVTERGPTTGPPEVDNIGSTEDLAENIVEEASVDEVNKEKNMLRAEDIAEKHMLGIESEVTKSTEPVATKENSDQKHISLLDDSVQRGTSVCEKEHMGSALEINEMGKTTEETIRSSEPQTLDPESVEKMNETEATKPQEDNVEDEIDPPVGMEQEREEESVETSGVQEVQGLGTTEQTRGIEATETEDHQQHRVSTLEEPIVDNKPVVDDYQVHKEKPAELKDNEVMEAEPFLEQSSISTRDNAPEERSELGNDPESLRDTEDSKLSKENETSDQKISTLEDTATEDNVEDEIDPPVGMEQEREQESVETSDVQEVQELGTTEQTRGIETTETEDHQQQRVSTLEEPIVDNKPVVDDYQVHEEKPEELKENEAMEAEPFLEQSSISTPDNAPEERGELGNDPESLRDTEDSKILKEKETSEQKSITLEDTAKENNVEDEIDPPVGMEQVQEQESVETSDVQEVQGLGTTEQTRGIEATETEDHQQQRVSTLEEPIVDNKTVVDVYQVHEEKPEELKENEAMEAEPVLGQSIISTPDNAPEEMSELGNDPESLRDSEDTKLLKEKEISDQKSITREVTATENNVEDKIDPPVGMEQVQEQESVETSDVQKVQELGTTEQTRRNEAMETEDHQQHRVCTLQEPAVDNKQDVDDHQVNEERPAELKGNEAMEAEQVLEQSNISTPENAPEERSELENDPGCCVQPALQVQSSKDSEDSKLLKEEVTSDEKIITLEDTATKYNVEDEIDPPVGMEQEDEQKSVEEIKDIDANEAKENFHTSQLDTLDKLASESSTTSELKYDIQDLNDLEMKETRSIEGINDGDISCEQREIASADPPPTNNEIAPQEHPVESHEENLGNEAENAMLAPVMKDEIQTSAEHKDDAIYLDESVSTTKKSKNLVDEDVIQSYGEDTLENSSQRSSEHHAENIAHIQDKDINRELVTERGTAEASQTLIENNAQASQDITENDDTMKTGEQTNYHRQAGDAEYLPQTCESSVDAEVVQKVSLDEDKRHKEDEAIESQQLQADEQKVKDEGDDVSNEPLVESKDTEIRTTNMTEETDTLEAGQTEAVINETPKIEQALNTSEDSTPSITDTTVEGITGTDKGVEEENRLNSANTSDVDGQMDKQEDDENTGKDNILPTDPTSGQEETADEITNEEDPITVPYNAESGEYEHKECTNKVNDDLVAIQEPVKEIAAGMQENIEMRNGTKGVHYVESHTKAEEKEMSQQCSNEPNKVDTKIDDTIHNTTVNPIEIGDIGENNVEQDLSIHHKVEDEKLEAKVDNDVELEAMQQKVDTSNVYTNNDDHLSVSNSLTKHETESANDALQLETEGNTFDKVDETVSHEKKEASNTSVHEIVTFNEEICDKVTGAEEGLSEDSLKTFHGTSRNIDVSSVVIESNEKSTNVDIEDHKLAAPEHSTMDENTPKQEKPLPADPEEQEDDPTHKKQDKEGMHEPDFGDDQKEVEQDLPVSNFLMNLILGKENSDANEHSEPEAETKQEETRDDNSCLIIPKQVESLALPPIENKVEDKLAIEQETNDAKCPEEKQEVIEEQSHDLKLGTETSLETDSELNKNSHHLELPPYQDKVQDEISNEILPEEAAEVFTKMEGKDTTIPNIKQVDGEADTVGQENIEVATQNEVGSLKNNLDDLNNTKTPDEDTLEEGQIRLLPECLNDARSVNSVTEQTLLSTESVMTNAKSLPSEDDSVPNLVCEIQDMTIESSRIIAASIPDIQVESEEDKTEEKQPTTTARGQAAEEHVEISNDNRQKSIGPEATSNGQEPQIAEQVSDTEIALGHGKEISEGSSSTFVDNKEDSNISVRDNIQTAVEIQAYGSNMQINQDDQEAADNKNEMESETLEESSIQEKQGNGTEEISPKECHEEDQRFSVKKEIAIKEGDVHETVKSHSDTVKIKANDEQELSDSKVQERDLSVLSPKDVHEPEESFVDTAKPEFSTNEERSPRADESNISEKKTYEGKIKDEERIENFTDEEVKTEAQVAEQKAAHKKQNLLSGVGSKVKHQLAKVKKAITGKPGNTKPKSPKA